MLVAIGFEMQPGAGDELHHSVVKIVRRKLQVAVLPANQMPHVLAFGFERLTCELRFRFIAK